MKFIVYGGCMSNNIKLICLDLDGTTLKDVSSISEKNKDMIKKIHDRGIKIALASGRILSHCLYFSELIDVPAYIVGNNGTYVYDKENDKKIYSSLLGVDNLLKIHNFVKGKSFNVHYSTIDTMYTNINLTAYHNEEEKGKYAMKEVVISNEKDDKQWKSVFENNNDKILKAVISSDNEKQLEDLIKNIDPEGAFELEYSWENTVEILKKGEGKGRGLKSLKKYLNLGTENVMCIGDSGNDISMFKESGYKVAMGNAINELKSMADFVTLKVSEDGVAHAIEKILL